MNSLVQVNNNEKYGLVTTSRIVAQGLGKQHSHVSRTLEGLISENPNLDCLIIPTTYKVKGQKREYKEYLLTKDGFTLYMFNIQGYNDFKMAYIKEFNRMEKALKEIESKQLELDSYEVIMKTYKNSPVMVVKDIEYMTGLDKSTINCYIRNNNLGTLLVGRSLHEIRFENKTLHGVSNSLNILYEEDVVSILNYFSRYEDNKRFVDDYFKENHYDRLLDIKTFKKLVSLKMLRHSTDNFSLSEYMKKELDYIISKEYVKLGFLDKPVDDLSLGSVEGWNLLSNINKWNNKSNIK